MITNSTHKNALISPSRSIAAKVELYDGSTLLNTFNHTDALSSFTVSRAGAKKFFGFGVCQEIELKLIDKERAINVSKNQYLKVRFMGISNNSSLLFMVRKTVRTKKINLEFSGRISKKFLFSQTNQQRRKGLFYIKNIFQYANLKNNF